MAAQEARVSGDLTAKAEAVQGLITQLGLLLHLLAMADFMRAAAVAVDLPTLLCLLVAELAELAAVETAVIILRIMLRPETLIQAAEVAAVLLLEASIRVPQVALALF